MANKVKFGLSNVWIAKMITGEDGTITYGTPFKIPGAVSLSLDQEGEESPFYADNIKFFNTYSNNGYAGDLEIALVPQQFETDILGQLVDSNGAVIESNTDTISPFALGYQVEGDETGTKFWYYNAMVSRPSAEANTTEESITPDTSTLSITTSARVTDNKVRAKLQKDSTNAEAYDDFFNSVYELVI